ncbi:MAG: aldo/keto reductase [Polyangiaceae bacterium]|nr:aldo/keto reductase [Polyangiaceae bacterium]
METRAFGPLVTGAGAARAVPVIGLGTWQMEGDRLESAIGAIRRGLDLGMLHVDTAEMYGSGKVEEIVAEAIEGRRDEVFLVSKVLPTNASKKGTIEACERSLRRLKTDRLDLYLLHWRGDYPLSDTIGAFERLVKDGKIRAWGVSNFDVPDMEEAIRIAGEGKVACNQVLYHLKERSIEHEVLPFCEAHQIAVVGYSPFGSGDFPAPESPGGRVLSAIGAAHGVSARAVALRFLVRRPALFTIPKSSHAGRVEENARAGDFELSDEETRQIDAAFPLGKRRRGVPTI